MSYIYLAENNQLHPWYWLRKWGRLPNGKQFGFTCGAIDAADRLGFRYSVKNALKTLQSHTATEHYVDAVWAARNSKNNTENNNASSS